MNLSRRNFMKSSLAVACAGLTSSCNNANDTKSLNQNIIKPEQTGTYKFSAPLPFNYELIDEIFEYNKTLKKAKVVTLYNNIPFPLTKGLNGFFQNPRGINENIKSFDDFAKYVQYAQSKGFKFTYLMNSPKGISEKDFNEHKNVFYSILDMLKNINCNNIKVANTQVAQLINTSGYDFTLSASTSFEFHNVSQYSNLLMTYPNIKTINISIDDNRNFSFLKTLKKLFPDVEIEPMVNELCIIGCPARISHPQSYYLVYQGCHSHDCYTNVCKNGNIYPWNLEYYSAIGINNFKLVSLPMLRANISSIDFLKNYISAIENDIDDMPASYFFNKVLFTNMPIKNDKKISEIKHLLPDIEHFVKQGDKCANICKAECNYCISCAENLKRALT